MISADFGMGAASGAWTGRSGE